MALGNINVDSPQQRALTWILGVIAVSLYVPLLITQLYFRHDDSQVLLWAKEFSQFWLTAFNPQLWLDEFYAYPGVGGYYRPFESLYVMAILRTLGAEPFYFHFFNAILILGTFVFLFKIIELFSSRYLAFFGIVFFHAAFNAILYGLTHVVVPFGYFFELGAIYFFLLGLSRQKNWAFFVAWLFYIPATNRQTSMILIPVLIALYMIDQWKEIRAHRKKLFALLIASILPNLVLPFSGFVSTGTLLTQPFSFETYSRFVLERYYFYGDLMTRGITGMFLMFPVGYAIGAQVLTKFGNVAERKQTLIASAVGLVFVSLILLPGDTGTYVATIALVYLFFTDRSVRLGLGWFFVSTGVFLMVDYYHGGYFVEAAMGLVFGLALLYRRIFTAYVHHFAGALRSIATGFRSLWQGRRKIAVIAAAIILLLSFGFTAYNVFSPKLKAVIVLIQTNRNFEDTVNYMVSSLPPNAVIYQLTNEEMGLNDRIWRFHSLRERAENVKIMKMEDLSAMVKVLERYDIQLRPSQQLLTDNNAEFHIADYSRQQDESAWPKYFLVYGAKEKAIAEKRFSLRPLQLFKRGETVAGIYVVEHK